MKHLDGQYYVEVEDHRYKIQPTKNNILGLRGPPNSLRLENQVQNGTQIKKNQKVIENNGKLEVKKILKMKNNQLFNNQSLNHQMALPVR